MMYILYDVYIVLYKFSMYNEYFLSDNRLY